MSSEVSVLPAVRLSISFNYALRFGLIGKMAIVGAGRTLQWCQWRSHRKPVLVHCVQSGPRNRLVTCFVGRSYGNGAHRQATGGLRSGVSQVRICVVKDS
jgi:hypothetical protein